MPIETTISTHFGHQAHRAHNTREERVVEKQPHIDPNGEHEIWVDKDPREAYHELFDKAVEEYNERQKREDRKITDYFEKVKSDKTLHPVYETITQVGGKDSPIPREEQKEMLREYAQGWAEANPNMIMIGCYYHNDEQGGPHLHIDFIPVAHGYSRGMETQTSLTRAIKEQSGITPIKHEKQPVISAQTQWQRTENDRLQEIVESRGYRVIHPERDKSPEERREHQHDKIYKESQDLDRKRAEMAERAEKQRALDDKQLSKEIELGRKKRALERKEAEQQKNEKELEAREQEARKKEEQAKELQREANAIIERDERARATAKEAPELRAGMLGRVSQSDLDRFNDAFREMSRMANSANERAEMMKGERDRAMKNENIRQNEYIRQLEERVQKAERDSRMMDFLRENNPQQARTLERQFTRHEYERERAERAQSRDINDRIKEAEERQREENRGRKSDDREIER